MINERGQRSPNEFRIRLSLAADVCSFFTTLVKEAGLALCSVLLMLNRLACDRGLVLERPNALSARMIRNGDRHLGDVVLVIGFRQLMADAGAVRVGVAARLVPRWDKPRIDSDPDDVFARWDRRLAIAAVE